jgi:hypothetical protein
MVIWHYSGLLCWTVEYHCHTIADTISYAITNIAANTIPNCVPSANHTCTDSKPDPRAHYTSTIGHANRCDACSKRCAHTCTNGSANSISCLWPCKCTCTLTPDW